MKHSPGATHDTDGLPAAGAPTRPPRWLLFVQLGAVLAIGALIVAMVVVLRQPGARSTSASRSGQTGSMAQGSGPLGALDNRPPVVGEPAPNFALLDTEGRRVELAALHGKAVVVNFWATWCGPCREEFPELQKVAEGMSDDVVVLALDQAESASKVRQFRDEFGATFTILMDSRTAVNDAYRLRGVPDTVFIDRDGVVRDVVLGPLSAGTFRYKIAQTLKPR
jgi:peroxiredoxin